VCLRCNPTWNITGCVTAGGDPLRQLRLSQIIDVAAQEGISSRVLRFADLMRKDAAEVSRALSPEERSMRARGIYLHRCFQVFAS